MAERATTPTRGGSVPAHEPSPADFEKLAAYPHLVANWIGDDGYPLGVAVAFETDAAGGTVTLTPPAGVAIPEDREISVIGSHIRPLPGVGYDERRYLQVWGRVSPAPDGRLRLVPTRAWGWDENEVPFFEYSERSVPQSRRYLALLSQEQGRTIRPRLSLFWLALRTTRLPFLSATAVPVLLGIAVAASDGLFNPWLALLTLIGASFAHLGINVSNDIFDTLSGADDANVNPTQFSGGSRVLIYDLLTLRQLIAVAAGLFGVAAVIGLLLVWLTGSMQLLWIGIAGIVLGIAYTAPPLKLVYRGLGEAAVGIGFGPIMLLGAYVVQTGRISFEAVVASLPVGILIALILFVNEIPDRSGDAAAGKRTLPVRWSPSAVLTAYFVAALAAFGIVVAGVIGGQLPWPTLIALACVPLVFRIRDGIRANYNSPYTLMAVMGQNVNLAVLAGGLLLVGYLVWIVAGLLGLAPTI
jgi:1,4-dihydroxy-2-naphthoate octaprenyltransferase